MSTQEQKIESAIADLIDSVERFFDIAPLRFLDMDGGNDDISCFTFLNEHETRFHRFENWFAYLIETLEPWAGDVQEKVEEAEKILNPIIRAVNENDEDETVSHSWGVMCDSVGELAFAAQKIGFYVGVFIGAKRQGATRDDLVKIGKGLMLPCLEQWEHAERNAEEAEAKKSQENQENRKQRRDAFKLVKGEFHA